MLSHIEINAVFASENSSEYFEYTQFRDSNSFPGKINMCRFRTNIRFIYIDALLSPKRRSFIKLFTRTFVSRPFGNASILFYLLQN